MPSNEILDLETRRIAAMVNRDVAFLDDILADDMTYVHSGGRRDTKASFLAMIGSPETTYLGIDYTNAEVRDCGDAQVVRGVCQIRLRRPTGEELSYPVWFVNVYARRNGNWQMVAWQATRAPE
jgi:hypothetical protein